MNNLEDRDIRLQNLRILCQEMLKLQTEHDIKAEEFHQIVIRLKDIKIKFQNYREDLVGDLFNGCFGQEWLLI